MPVITSPGFTVVLVHPLATIRMIAGPPMGINFIATNVPGAQVPMYLAGHQMLDFVGLVPLAGALGYGVAILSYNQSLYFGLTVDPRLIPDVEFMKSCIAAAFEELKATAQRAISGEQQLKNAAEQVQKRDSAVS